MVLDGCYRISAALNHVGQRVRHEERIQFLCSRYQLNKEVKNIKAIVKLRNDLFHETLWDGSQPCGGGSSSAWYQVSNLRRFNHRLIAAMVGYDAPYIRTTWSARDVFEF